jgi:molecular chaperone GrpE
MVKKKVQKQEKELRTDDTAELKNQLARALADYDNLKKRVELEKEIWVKFSSERILIKMVSVLDMFESALEHVADQGLGIAISEFRKVLEEEGLEEIKPQMGEIFNENLHEAIEAVENGEKDKVAETVLAGWKFRDN